MSVRHAKQNDRLRVPPKVARSQRKVVLAHARKIEQKAIYRALLTDYMRASTKRLKEVSYMGTAQSAKLIRHLE